jgi:imidazolonepropionase-like amidohydrolase
MRWSAASLVLAGFAVASTREALPAESLVLKGARIYASPTDSPIEEGVVVIRDGKIAAVGSSGVALPAGARVIDCKGLVVTAGFWNSHVHFFRPDWQSAAKEPAPELAGRLREMLTRFGFTTVFDIGSVLENTLAIRDRIESGEVDGPTIFTTGTPIYAKGGTPRGVRTGLLPEVNTVDEARRVARELLENGADGLKAYVYSPSGAPGTPVMSPEIIRALVEVAHAEGKPVFAHPENRKGLRAAVEGGVDVLAHTVEEGGAWDGETITAMRRSGISLVPTLYLYEIGTARKGGRVDPGAPEYVVACRVLDQLREFSEAGGRVLFGTDVGFYEDLDMSAEFRLMARAGLDWKAILASLTTGPAEQFDAAHRSGRVAPGLDADLVVLAADPATDVMAFSNVRFTIRSGKVIYEAAG